jgi:hypothetical protein
MLVEFEGQLLQWFEMHMPSTNCHVVVSSKMQQYFISVSHSAVSARCTCSICNMQARHLRFQCRTESTASRSVP